MKRYMVEITEDALADLEALYDHIAGVLLAPENALRQYNRIAGRILELDTFPERFRILASEPERSNGIRRMSVDHYSVFYIIRQDKVIVTNILYSASDMESRLR